MNAAGASRIRDRPRAEQCALERLRRADIRFRCSLAHADADSGVAEHHARVRCDPASRGQVVDIERNDSDVECVARVHLPPGDETAFIVRDDFVARRALEFGEDAAQCVAYRSAGEDRDVGRCRNGALPQENDEQQPADRRHYWQSSCTFRRAAATTAACSSSVRKRFSPFSSV